jgi:hypothetical protein
MRRPNCPKTETLFELVTVAAEMPRLKRARLNWHLRSCSACKTQAESISQTWSGFFAPEPEVTSSLLKVYSRLQNDETLILKGWKLSQARVQRRSSIKLADGWLVRGGVAAAVVGALSLVFWSRSSLYEDKDLLNASATLPFAQIRIEDKNTIKVHYVQPELLNTMEFETADQR